MPSKFKPKDKLLGKRISNFISTENERLWIPSRLMWFDRARPPEEMSMGKWSLADHYSQDFCIFLGYPHDSAPYLLEAVWKEWRPNSQILFINVCFHLNGLGHNWLMTQAIVLKVKRELWYRYEYFLWNGFPFIDTI